MARFLRLSRSFPLKTLAPYSPPSRTFISEMRRSAFKENLLRVLRAEIAFESESRPPLPPSPTLGPFSLEDRPGEAWVRLRRRLAAGEELKLDATMFDGASPAPSPAAKDAARLHISVIVEVAKPEGSEDVLNFVCSAWPDALDVEKVFPSRRDSAAIRPYMGPDFKELDDELQNAVREYLEERGVNDELAESLHGYMTNKDRTELVRWLGNVESYIKR